VINECSVIKCAISKINDSGSYQAILGRNDDKCFQLNDIIKGTHLKGNINKSLFTRDMKLFIFRCNSNKYILKLWAG
jgi:hypothetical protein